MALETPTMPAKEEDVVESPARPESRPSLEAHDTESSTDLPPSVQFHEPDTPSLTRRATEASPSSTQLPLPTSIGPKPKGLLKLLELVPDASDTSGDLQTEIIESEFSVALDKTFVDTSSGPAARELKRRWDLQLGLARTVRSPYAITAFVNQHGKQMFRVSRRDLSAPAANAAQIEDQMTRTSMGGDITTSPRNSRRSRMSMNPIPSMFAKNPAAASSSKALNNAQGPIPRKLRKTRSIPDLVGQGSYVEPTVGRAHSKSVTGADVAPFCTIIRHDFPSSDIFADAMGWLVPPLTPGSSYSTSSQISSDQYSNDYLRTQLRIAHPFGAGISYDSPLQRYAALSSPSPPLAAPMPRHLREMQSFESGLTARQDDSSIQSTKVTPTVSQYNLDEVDVGRPLSAMRLHPPGESTSDAEGTPTTPSPAPIPEVTLAPPPESNSVSRYSTDVFDVLQTYRGLPQIDKFSLEKGDTTFKMSLSADESAAPRDDPRFVIWGESPADRDSDDHSASHESVTDSSNHSNSVSKRRMSRAKPQETTVTEGPQRILLAATIERWIAQLTSDLSYEELLDFFLTYRTYVSAVDLCHLLICRFQWSLLQPTSLHDEKVRRIVRVRTFVAIRFWILTFFAADFIPNRDLRLLFGDWLNTLIRDPILKKHSDGVGIVRKLMKVAKDCKEQHIKIPTKSRDRSSSTASKGSGITKPHILGEKFAAAVQKTVKDDEESDVDLDFLPEEGKTADDSQNILTEAPNSGFTPTRPTSLPASSQSILQRTDLGQTMQEADAPYVQVSSLAIPLPMQHNAISRVFVKTIGRLGRWKRVLNSRATVKPVPGSSNIPSIEVEATETKGLLTVDPQGTKAKPQLKAAPRPRSSHVYPTPSAPSLEPTPATDGAAETLDKPSMDVSQLSSTVVNTDTSSTLDSSSMMDDDIDDRPQSFRSTSTDSFGKPLTTGGPAPLFPDAGRTQWAFDVVSIDELDFSDTSSVLESAPAAPPGLKKQPKKLPLRRDFEFLKRPETVSSLGIRSRDSVASETSNTSSGINLGGNVAQWQLNALVDSLSDEEEVGDVEDALKRLEGQVNPQRQQEKASKVDGWVRNIQKRMAAGDYIDVAPRFSDDEEDYEEDSPDASLDGKSETKSTRSSVRLSITAPSLSVPGGEGDQGDDNVDMVKTPVPSQTSHFPEGSTPAKSSDANPPPRDVVPREIWQSRLPSRPSTADSAIRPSFSRIPTAPSEPRWTPSFIFSHRAADVAEHFAMIDRDLFMAIGFEELFQDWWSPNEIEVLDWEQFLRDRTRWKAEGRFPHRTSVLGAVRARFNVMANFTISEIVSAPPAHRPMLVDKFIRIAWRSYCMSSFATLVAIVAGLSSDWVTKAMRKPGWLKVGMWEKRMLKDLKLFTDGKDDFKYLRHNIAAIVDAKTAPADPTQSTATLGSGAADGPTSGKGKAGAERPPVALACIPFIGVYLSQLKRAHELPDVIDPTAPEEPIGVNAVTSNLETPSRPEVFSALAPLPEGMNLEPLINVQKQRRVAGVIKSLVAAQHVASRIQFDVDKKLFQKCLKLSGLKNEELQRKLVQGYPE